MAFLTISSSNYSKKSIAETCKISCLSRNWIKREDICLFTKSNLILSEYAFLSNFYLLNQVLIYFWSFFLTYSSLCSKNLTAIFYNEDRLLLKRILLTCKQKQLLIGDFFVHSTCVINKEFDLRDLYFVFLSFYKRIKKY